MSCYQCQRWMSACLSLVLGSFLLLSLVAQEPAEPPQTDTPQTDAPQTDAPQTDAPQTDAPQTDAPQTDAPQTTLLKPTLLKPMTRKQKLQKQKLQSLPLYRPTQPRCLFPLLVANAASNFRERGWGFRSSVQPPRVLRSIKREDGGAHGHRVHGY